METLRFLVGKSVAALLVALVGLGLLISSSKPTMAQDVASLTGVVTDSSGAVVVDADVKLVDTKTNTQYQTRTNSTGSYTFTKVLPGPGYQLSVSKEGFQTQTISGIYVGVNATHTQNAELSVGQATQTVEVNAHASTVSLNTTDATVGNNFDMNLVQNLPVLVRDTPTSLLGYQPGTVALSTGSQTGDDTGTQSRSGSVTGARTDQNNITLDGIDVNDFAGGFGFDALVANAPVDSVQEFRGEVANPLSAEGRGSGAQVTLVTKSGTNGFHGAGYEYYRTRGFQANDFFNNFANPVVPRVPLVRNQFGADLGGPIIKDKLFFFFNYEGRRDARGNPVLRTVPLPSFKQGNIAYLNQSGGVSVLPATAPGTQASVQNFDPLGIGADPALTSFLNQRYPDPNSTAAGDGLNSGGFQFNAPGNQTLNDYVVRLDYNISDTMKVFARGSMVREIDDRDPSIRFPGDPLTFIDTDHSYGFVFGHTWTISSTKVNQFVYGETVQALNFPYLFNPNGTTVYDSFGATGTGGAFLSAPYFTPAAQARKIPIPEYRDDFTYLRGRHTFQVGGTFKPIKTTSFLRSDFNEVPVGLGGGLTGLSGGSTQLQPNDLATDSVSQNLYDSAFAFILGNIPSVDSSYNNDRNLQPLPQGTGHTRQYRYYETEAYLQDSFKARPDLTLTYGLRYQFDSVAYEVNGLEAVPNIGFDQAIAPRIANGAAGVSGFFANPIITYSLGGKVNHGAPLYHPDWHNFQPRLAFAYNPSFSQGILGRVFGDRKTVIRAGAGIVDDHTLVNALNFLQDQNTWILQNSASQTFATDGDPTVNLQNDPRFTATNVVPPGGVQPPPAITTPYSPAFANGNPWGLASFSGLAFNYAIDPNLKTPYSYAVTFGFQRELPSNFQLEMSYDGRFAHRLLAQADAMQVVNFRDPASGTDLVSQFAKLSLAVRNNDPSINDPAAFPFFENVMNPAMLANPNLGVNCETIFGGAFPSCASLLDAASSPLDFRGDMADVLQVLNGVFANSGDVGLIEPGVGLNPQFGSSLYMTNKGYSNYNGLLVTLHHKASHGLQFDLNYTWSHSLDNISAAANNAFGNGAGAGGIMCDAINIRVCYANSDFDVRHNITGDWFYQLPFGRGKTFASTAPVWLDEVIGGWTISGLVNWRTGLAFQTVANAFPISFANNVPAVFNGDTSALEVSPHREINAASGLPTIQLFKNPTKAMNSFTGPLGLQAGSRNNLRGPHYSDFDMGVGKHFPITERVGLTFRADAQNVFNHTNFELPGTDGTADITSPSSFGVITGDYGARVLQLALRLDF